MAGRGSVYGRAKPVFRLPVSDRLTDEERDRIADEAYGAMHPGLVVLKADRIAIEWSTDVRERRRWVFHRWLKQTGRLRDG